jgi:2-polyprenyl-3-methyl-5-hydroxy-6-metoxy-1,4-benzoquinol methylase
MPASKDYHEALWEALPEGLEPVDFARRRSFLLGHVRAGERVLDVGCGEGRFAAELARAGAEVVGIDVAAEPLRRARASHPELDLRQAPVVGAWPLPDASFDAVWAGEVIEHVADTAGWLSELRRVLRSGGRLLLSTPDHGLRTRLRLMLSGRAFGSHFDPRADHLRFYTRATLRALIREFGFDAVDVRPVAGRVLLARAVRARF